MPSPPPCFVLLLSVNGNHALGNLATQSYPRTLARPWATDTFLQSIMRQFVEKNKSITKIIQYSPAIKDMFCENRKKCTEEINISPAVRDFCYASHRYHTEAKVLMRLVLTFDATIETASQVIRPAAPVLPSPRPSRSGPP